METKECKTCKKHKTLDWFEFRNDNKKYRHQCNSCRSEYRGCISRQVVTEERDTLINSGYKVCGKCTELKSLDNYNLDKYMPNGYTSWCKSCKKEYNQTNKHIVKGAKLRQNYNIEYSDFVKMVEEQDNRCLICTNTLSEDPRHVHVDHCHDTMKVRGVLCRHCNLMLGNARDNILVLKSAIKYLEKHSK